MEANPPAEQPERRACSEMTKQVTEKVRSKEKDADRSSNGSYVFSIFQSFW